MRTILVLDDDIFVASAMRTILGYLGRPVETFTDPDDLISAAKAGKPAGLIIDVQLGPLNGEDVARRCWRELGADTPIMMYSGGTVVSEIDGRPVTFMGKPFTPELVEAKMKEARFSFG